MLGVLYCLLAGPAAALLMQDDWQAEVARDRGRKDDGAPDEAVKSKLEFRFDESSSADKLAQETLNLLRSGKADEAVHKARELVKTHPKWASGHELLGTALALQGQLDEGLKALKEAVSLNQRQYTAITKIGDIYKSQGNSAEAKKQYLEAIRYAPTDGLTNQRLGLMAEEEGNAKAAIEYFKKGLVGTPPDYVGIKVNLGRLYNATHEYAKTVELLQPVVSGAHSNPIAYVVLGTALAATDKIDDSIKAFVRAKELDPRDSGYRLALGISYRQAGAFDKSLAELAEANRLKPDWSTGLFQYAETLTAMARYADALVQYRKAEKVAANPTLIRKRIGDLQMATKDLPGAISTYKQITANKNAPIDVVAALAMAYQLNGQPVEAEAAYRQVVQMAPKDPSSYLRLGLFYGYQRNYREALAVLNEGLSIDLKNADLLRATAIMQSRLNRHDDAVFSAERLANAQPDSPDAQLLLAMMLEEAGKRPRAKGIYEAVLAKHPKNVVAQNNLAMLLSEDGKHELAILAARRSLDLKPGDPMLMDTLGWVLYQAGKSTEGLAVLTDAATKGPGFPSIHYHLGVVHQSLRDDQAARADFDRALALPVDFRDAEDARKRRSALR